MAKYCDPDKTITFATPTANVVNAYITELSQMSYLPPCARSGLSYAVMGDMSSKCPKDASLYAPCVCNSDRAKAVSETLSKSVRSSCSNDEDVTAAQGFFNQYCAMNSGTTSFAGPQQPPGDMTYYITALPQYKSLRACAQSAMSYAILAQTEYQCGTGPQALASCACLKSGMRGKVSSTLTSQVKGYCSSTATDDVTSAISVWEYYCSAAENKVVAKVSESISEAKPAATAVPSRSRPGSSLPSETGGGGGGGGTSNKNDPNNDGSGGGTNKVAVIAASVLGAIVAIALAVGLFFFFRRRNRRKQRGEQLNANSGGGYDANGSAKYASPSVVTSMPELSTPSHSPRPELQGNATSLPSELPPHQGWARSELQGNGMQGQHLWPNQSPYEAMAPNSGSQVSPQSTIPNYGSPTAVSHNGGDGGYWRPHGGEAYELGSNMPRR
ncbi:hypothetical protein QQS21_001440 [Conoideocrella luteorostrata]|uniref:Uncharacterized protein n=1 Tax=Conoideocrella luteorostrata TaxID=1105319 RepID=A0AAJ0D0K5_9HYPO|nr:hypothetical protein QQS21_001440 [Conoideocrella luteorostrata]